MRKSPSEVTRTHSSVSELIFSMSSGICLSAQVPSPNCLIEIGITPFGISRSGFESSDLQPANT